VQGLRPLTLEEVIERSRICGRASARRPKGRTTPTASKSMLSHETSRRIFNSRFAVPLLSDDLQTLAVNIAEPGRLADFIASSSSSIGTPIKQEVLETLDIRARMDTLNRIPDQGTRVLELGSKIQSQVQSEVGKNQREYFLREQMKAIQKELGEGDDQPRRSRSSLKRSKRPACRRL
jgi:ATP-dependent Lon protease